MTELNNNGSSVLGSFWKGERIIGADYEKNKDKMIIRHVSPAGHEINYVIKGQFKVYIERKKRDI
jgi:quercetin dioxygenase-like cupin family protein